MKANGQRSYSIPVATNLTIVAVCSALYFFLFYAASHSESVAGLIMFGFAFAVTMVPVYSLIHEAEHNMLHPNPVWNDLVGRWLCCLFVASFAFFTHCHFRHHKKNRTDIEMWELYYAHQNKWKRRGNLFLMMSGLGYFSLWLSVLLFAFAPSLVYRGFFQKHTEIAGFLEGSNQPEKLAAMRWESWLAIGFQVTLIVLLQLSLESWLTLFLIHGFVWSSQSYVNHAFSPRNIINGAHNLRMPPWLKFVYLNFNLHLAHHQNPGVPWIHLPHFIQNGSHRIGFFRNYLRLWTGPRLTTEPNPTLHQVDRANSGPRVRLR